MARSIIIDTDPGVDDAVAILLALAAPELEVLGLTVVAGNVPLAITERNARSILELAGRGDVPVFAGCPRPIGRHRNRLESVHGTSGLGNLVLPEPGLSLRPEHAVAWLIESLRGAHGVTLCPIGPLTNIATALVMAPDIAGGISEIVLMGGGTRGNTTPAAEFNMWADPQAAAIVFDSGVPITMVPLDVTLQVRSTQRHIDQISALGTRCAAAVAELISPPRATPGRPAMPMHDPCVIAFLLAPELFGGGEAHVAIETQSPLTLGMTSIDRRRRDGQKANARVLDTVDADGVYRLLTERLAHLP